MEIKKIDTGKEKYLDLLLLGDEQEDMIYRYLDRGDLFALYDGDLRSICVVTKEGDNVYELKNVATYEQYQKKGYGREIVKYILKYYEAKGAFKILVGTGEDPRIIKFYERCGFILSHRVENFFTDNYDHPIMENGVQLVDMIYLKKEF